MRGLLGFSSACLVNEAGSSVFDSAVDPRAGVPGSVRAERVAESLRSGSRGPECLIGMHIAYLIITIVAAVAYGYAAFLNLVGAERVRAVADEVRVSQKWMLPFGALLACGALGY